MKDLIFKYFYLTLVGAFLFIVGISLFKVFIAHPFVWIVIVIALLIQKAIEIYNDSRKE